MLFEKKKPKKKMTEESKMNEIVANIARKVNQAYMEGKIKRLNAEDYYPLLTDEERQALDYVGKKAIAKFLKGSFAS